MMYIMKTKLVMLIRNYRPVLILVCVLLFILDCDQPEFSQPVVTGRVAKTLNPESNTAFILVGTVTVKNLLNEKWLETPDPEDTAFWANPFPAEVTPMANAEVKINDQPITYKAAGIYFQAGMDLEYLHRYELTIATPDRATITAYGFLPDSFSILLPQERDSLRYGIDTLKAVWTKSDSAHFYLVAVPPADSASPAIGWNDAIQDTTCIIPFTAFQDTLGNPVSGEYLFSVTAVNGGWKKGALDLFFSGGNLKGALGTFGCAFATWPRRILVR